jgi:hypothetical protein
MIVRNQLLGEKLPSVVVTGFESLPMDENWCWHAIMDGVIVGTLVCCPCHGVVILFRLVIHESAPPYTLRRLLRTMFEDCNARGYKGYIILFGPMREKERRFIKMVRRIGGTQILEPTVMFYGVNPGVLEPAHA